MFKFVLTTLSQKSERWPLLISGIAGIVLISALAIVLWPDEEPSSTVTNENINGTGIPLELDIAKLPTFTPLPSATHTQTTVPTITSTYTPVSTSTVAVTVTISAEATVVSTEIAQAQPTDDCIRPEGWTNHQVQAGETLFAFQLGSSRAGTPTTVDEILAANCLDTTFLTIGQTLWLPDGAAENAPSSEPYAPDLPAGVNRDANCPCTITVRDGWRIEQIADEINRQPVGFSGADFLAYVRKGASIPNRGFLVGVPSSAGLEGFMLPGSYTLQNDTTAEQFRDMMLNAFEAQATQFTNAAGNHGMSAHELVILASIIQRESYAAEEQVLVSSVFHNRRNAGKGFAATVTLQYAVGGPGNWWPAPYSGITSLDSPYNTNIYGGFPPTPIANPGLSALQAAAFPAQTPYQYFTGDCRGPGNAYAETFEQHLANVRCE